MASHHVVLRARVTPLGLMWRAVCTATQCPWMGEPRVQPAYPGIGCELADRDGWDPDEAYKLARQDRDTHLVAPDLVIDWTVPEAWLHGR